MPCCLARTAGAMEVIREVDWRRSDARSVERSESWVCVKREGWSAMFGGLRMDGRVAEWCWQRPPGFAKI